MSGIDCSAASLPLLSALDDITHKELHNSDFTDNCNSSKLAGGECHPGEGGCEFGWAWEEEMMCLYQIKQTYARKLIWFPDWWGLFLIIFLNGIYHWTNVRLMELLCPANTGWDCQICQSMNSCHSSFFIECLVNANCPTKSLFDLTFCQSNCSDYFSQYNLFISAILYSVVVVCVYSEG